MYTDTSQNPIVEYPRVECSPLTSDTLRLAEVQGSGDTEKIGGSGVRGGVCFPLRTLVLGKKPSSGRHGAGGFQNLHREAITKQIKKNGLPKVVLSSHEVRYYPEWLSRSFCQVISMGCRYRPNLIFDFFICHLFCLVHSKNVFSALSGSATLPCCYRIGCRE